MSDNVFAVPFLRKIIHAIAAMPAILLGFPILQCRAAKLKNS